MFFFSSFLLVDMKTKLSRYGEKEKKYDINLYRKASLEKRFYTNYSMYLVISII